MKIEFLITLLKQIVGYSHWGMIANLALFLSALFFLINFAPRDILPGYQSQKQALLKLKSDKNILGDLPERVRITPESAGMSIIQDKRSFLILKEMAQKYSPDSNEIDWNNIIGIGYSVLSAPVGKYKVDAFKPVYVVEILSENSTSLILRPFGNLDDFEKWFSTQHIATVNIFALALLLVGFFMQLLIGLGLLGIKNL